MTWSEAEYLECPRSERRAFAWVMRHYGGLTPAEAREEALECHPYEPADHACRGLVLHDEAWHWAMLTIHGDRYAVEHPEPAGPPAEDEALG